MKSDFYQRVYAVVARIPYGKVTSYGAIARFLGAAKSSRMVGYALKTSVNVSHLPAHRVLNRKGVLTGKHAFGHSQLMEELLRSEGHTVEKDQVQHFQQHFWDPAAHLNPQNY